MKIIFDALSFIIILPSTRESIAKLTSTLSGTILLGVAVIILLYSKYNYAEEGRWGKDWNKKKKSSKKK